MRVAAFLKPVARGVLVLEVLHLRMHEMARDMRHHLRETAVGDDRDLSDFLMMVLDELQVRDERAKILPSGKLFGDHQYAIQYPILFEIGVDVACQRLKISRCK